MRFALIVVVLGACGGGPSVPTDGGDDDQPGGDGGGGGGNTGAISFDWQINVGPGLGTCEEVGAVQVEISSQKTSDGSETVRRFGCSPTGSGTVNALATGSYTNLVSLLDADGLPVSTQSTDLVTVTAGNTAILDLVTFRF
jgi:hypothetical protein